jgi:hypothetical protein
MYNRKEKKNISNEKIVGKLGWRNLSWWDSGPWINWEELESR